MGASPSPPRRGDMSPRTPRYGFGVLARRCAADQYAEAFALLAHRRGTPRKARCQRHTKPRVAAMGSIDRRSARQTASRQPKPPPEQSDAASRLLNPDF